MQNGHVETHTTNQVGDIKMWLRARFKANHEYSRPIAWPPPVPFWETGFTDDHAIVVAYVKYEYQVEEFWPEAIDVEFEKRNEITFTDRFQRPEWWTA